ncbi:MAG: helix-turn-helix domain-containing protein [Pseudomonadota bacterium]
MYDARPTMQERPTDTFVSDLRAICGAFDVDHPAEKLTGYATSTSKAGLDLAFVGQSARAIHRTTDNIATDPGNHFFLVLQTAGTAIMEQGDDVAYLEPGDMFLVDSTRPSSFIYQNRASHQLSLHLPRSETKHRFGKRARGGIAVNGGDPLARAMRSILSELIEGDAPHLGHVAEAFYGVLGAYLFNRSLGEGGSVNPDREIVNRAMHLIGLHFTDPDFSPTHLANLTGVSLRKLQRAFAVIKSSPHKRLQDARMDAASEMLGQASDEAEQSVTRIAFECGYRDLSTFYRQYKRRHGCAPSDRRAMQ